ncbi:hypothetical protein NliqN6_5420 [Naganishia liquefaciens]|uniref:UDP-N-acetylglucosamine diphosphorylase n=1 Tax=Naganishia liquefaciens TaxID=104408 RepID=A0A8H3YH61_9TREE|nr:hypothetical protein NliqN6_5420 [Naganishia liquefaciens]
MTLSPSLAALRTRYADAGQDHVFTFYDQLSAEEQQSLVRQLEGIDVDRVNRVWARAIKAEEEERQKAERAREDPKGGNDGIEPLPEEAMASLVADDNKASSVVKQADEWRQMGIRAIADNQVAVLLMAGGQGTRLGSSAPKGCYDIGLQSHKSLFQLQAERIRRLAQLATQQGKKPAAAAAARIPWYVMTSRPTRAETEAFFREHAFFGLDEEDVVFFDQGVLPALSNDGKIMLASKSSVAVAPDGNGGLYAAIRQSPSTAPGHRTVLQDMHHRGIRYVHAYCVDNCLVKVADPVFLGYCIAKRSACGAKVVRKEDPHESVGVLAMRDGAFSVVEYSELSREKAEQRTDRATGGGGLAYRAANIANHFYTLDFLDSVEAIESRMAFHIARKKIPTVDLATGGAVKPEAPNGMKLELFVFDVFPYTDALGVLEVERDQEFSPLKNAPASAGDNPETSRRDIYAQHRRWLEAAGARVADGCEVEVSPLASYNGEGLEQYRGKVFEKSTRLD